MKTGIEVLSKSNYKNDALGTINLKIMAILYCYLKTLTRDRVLETIGSIDKVGVCELKERFWV